MKCIGAIQGLFIWIILCIIAMVALPDSAGVIKTNASWILAIVIGAWWASGYVRRCD